MGDGRAPVCNIAPLPPAPPPPGNAPPAPEQHGYLVFGIVMVEVAIAFIALGANTQRYGLTEVSPSRKICGCIRCAPLC